MILKKPYAFLIKYFKLLHMILASLMIYLSVRINLITNLFDNLVDNVSVSLLFISDKYITSLMYIAIILIIGIGVVIWYLMKIKQKPNKYYSFILVYYVVLFIFLIVYNSVMETLEVTSITNQSLRIYRDFAFLIPLGQYYFIVIAILRGIGFNIKQFNFSKDIKDLEISDADSEEIEVKLSSNTYKYERAGRKRLRELKYYFFENKFWILIILGVTLLSIILYFFVNYKFVNNNYNEGSFVKAGNYMFQVNKTIITDKNLYGTLIKEGKKYLIVDLSIRNIYYENILFDESKFKLFINDKYYSSSNYKSSDFKDLGLTYDNKLLDKETLYNYILIYELDENVSMKNVKLRVYDTINYEKNEVDYINVNLNPDMLKEVAQTKKVDINENIVIDEGQYGKTNIIVKNYNIISNYEYTYDLCSSDKCVEKTGVILPSNILSNKLIQIEYNLELDKESNLYNFVKNDSSFYNTFVSLSYTLNGKKKSIKFNGITNSNIKNIIFLEVTKDIDNAESIDLIINTRKTKYVYKLK